MTVQDIEAIITFFKNNNIQIEICRRKNPKTNEPIFVGGKCLYCIAMKHENKDDWFLKMGENFNCYFIDDGFYVPCEFGQTKNRNKNNLFGILWKMVKGRDIYNQKEYKLIVRVPNNLTELKIINDLNGDNIT